MSNIVNGKTYEVIHSRKGEFVMLVKSQDEEWVDGIVVDGTAHALVKYNEKTAGESITVRRSFCSFKERRTV